MEEITKQNEIDTFSKVQNYYGKVLSATKDLKTSACCTIEAVPAYIRPLLQNVHEEIQSKFYGCGSPLPLELNGQTVLDLGCGTGRDVYVLSQLVGEKGKVIGLDMTEEQLAVASKHLNYQMDKFKFKTPNVEFKQGYIEDLSAAGIKDNSIDLIVSNCVTNLSPNKPKLFSEVVRVLKEGGELYMSDVFCDRRLPQFCKEDPILLGECLGGAMYSEDFRRLMTDLGIPDFRVYAKSEIKLTDPDVFRKIGFAKFYSITLRAFKIKQLEDRCEDYGQVAYYQGTIPEAPHAFTLDDHHTFTTHKPMAVCSNTAFMVSNSRFGKHFKVVGDLTNHLGLFDCGPKLSGTATECVVTDSSTGTCC